MTEFKGLHYEREGLTLHRIVTIVLLPIALVVRTIIETCRCLGPRNLWGFLTEGWRMEIESAKRHWKQKEAK